MSHFTDFTGYVLFIITSFLAGVESTDQCLLNSEVLSCFSGVIMSIRSFFLFSYVPQPRNALQQYQMHILYYLIRQFHKRKKFVANKCTYHPDSGFTLVSKDMGCEAFVLLEKQIEMRSIYVTSFLYDQSVWCCDYFFKINPKSNSISIVQIEKILWRDLLDLQACNRERSFKSRSQ